MFQVGFLGLVEQDLRVLLSEETEAVDEVIPVNHSLSSKGFLPKAVGHFHNVI
jgi:hypothetical protein